MSDHTHNPNCDGGHCKRKRGETRRLHIHGDSYAILCRSCFRHEMAYRTERINEGRDILDWPRPNWETLAVLAHEPARTLEGGY